MSNTIISTANTTGVRRLRTLGFLGTAPDPDTLAQLQAAGYDMPTIQSAIALGATDEQLLTLPFPASPSEIATATQQLMSQLSGLQAAPGQPSTAAPNFPQGAMPSTMISTGFGTSDLLQQSSWDTLNSFFVSAQQRLQALAAKLPGDPEVIGMVSQFNGMVAQWSN